MFKPFLFELDFQILYFFHKFWTELNNPELIELSKGRETPYLKALIHEINQYRQHQDSEHQVLSQREVKQSLRKLRRLSLIKPLKNSRLYVITQKGRETLRGQFQKKAYKLSLNEFALFRYYYPEQAST